MVETETAYSKSEEFIDNRLVTLAKYHMRPGGAEPDHYHRGIEIVLVLKGSCETHKEGRLYLYGPHQVHKFTNNSQNEVVLMVLTIPQDTPANTFSV